MIEVAAVAPLVASWSERVDFFALGTNDLIASALGIDRDDPVGTLSDDVLHPGLIRMIGEIISTAHQAGKPVSVCGEMASDPEGSLVLAALGADSLSLAVDRVDDVCRLLSDLDPSGLPALGSRLREAATVERIRELLRDHLASHELRERPSNGMVDPLIRIRALPVPTRLIHFERLCRVRPPPPTMARATLAAECGGTRSGPTSCNCCRK